MYTTMPTCRLKENSPVNDSLMLDAFQFWTSCFIHRAFWGRGLTIPSLQSRSRAQLCSYRDDYMTTGSV